MCGGMTASLRVISGGEDEFEFETNVFKGIFSVHIDVIDSTTRVKSIFHTNCVLKDVTFETFLFPFIVKLIEFITFDQLRGNYSIDGLIKNIALFIINTTHKLSILSVFIVNLLVSECICKQFDVRQPC